MKRLFLLGESLTGVSLLLLSSFSSPGTASYLSTARFQFFQKLYVVVGSLIGKNLMVLTGVFFFATFFISIIRVFLNQKISAFVCWIQLSAPSITLYASTLMHQPSIDQKEKQWNNHQRIWIIFGNSPKSLPSISTFILWLG